MVVIVPEPEIQPYRLIAGAIYSKSVMEQLPLRELSEVFACVMKPILVPNTIDTIAAAAVGEFHRVSNGDGQTRSVCMTCLTPVCISVDDDLIDRAESEHRCDLATETSI